MIFNPLHCHTQFSLLDGAANIGEMLKKASFDGMKACAITDHGNMFGVFQFVNEAEKHKIKPIVGCEFYLVADRHKKSFTKPDKDIRNHQILLAKNKEGYRNLSKLCSLGFIEGKYGNYPRIDKELILQYHKGLIATTCCLAAEVPRTILKKGEEEAEKVFKWWLDLFGEDYYIELQRHDIKEQDIVNEVLLKFAKKYNVPVIASNDSHYIDESDAGAHEILLAINTGAKMSDPVARDAEEGEESGAKKGRFAFPNSQFYFKTSAEMTKLFHDVPEAIDNTNLIADKVETLKLKSDILLPNFPIPEAFKIHQKSEIIKDTELKPDVLNQWEYLRHITMEGAKKRYSEITADIQERLDFELFTIKTMGFAGYFLIVSDFIKAGRDIGVFVGPGRGSAAGSAVAYCIGITNIDPIKYNLLFERFLNPDRKSMPDIDTDFDDEGRQKVIDYVVDKYGKNQVAQIVTYGTMAAKMSIKDVARVLDLPLDESNFLAKLVPEKPGISLGRIFHAPLTTPDAEKKKKELLERKSTEQSLNAEQKEELKKKIDKEVVALTDKEGLSTEDLEMVKQLREIFESDSIKGRVLKQAEILEGSVRGTGVHAAGIIIAPSDLTTLMPVATAKDSDLLMTQFEGKVIEDSGVIKMDFLGLKTLTIIKNCLALIKKNHGVEFDIDKVDLTDKKTFELFQKGQTNGVFQFENPGLQKFLRDLKPDKLEDLIAMTALYRPGPLQYVPSYIKRKNGQEPIVYDLEDMKEYLEETYGITVYQEQVMLLSQKLAGFTKGEADVLRKAMGKKDKATLDKMKSKFMEGAMAKNHNAKSLEKIWTDWESFAQYAFNKSHATCYAFVAFQMAWLKANYPSEFIAANLTNEKDNIEKVTFFLDESRKMGLKVLGPDINESSLVFDVNKQGEIRFGLGAIKGSGEAAVNEVIQVREKGGPFKDVFDFATRVNLRTVNKKTFESFAQAGAFDFSKDMHRAMYFYTDPSENILFLEKIIRHGQQVQEQKFANQNSLFGLGGMDVAISNPRLPVCEPWGDIEKLRLEKEVVGFYISGHPLDEYKLEIEGFCTCTLDKIEEHKEKDINVAGIVTSAKERTTKNGALFGIFTIEDYNGSQEMALWREDYMRLKHMLVPGQFLFIRGKVVPKYNMIDKYEIKPATIELLQEVRQKKARKVVLKLEPEHLTSAMIERLEEATLNYKGNCELRVEIKSNGMSIKLFSRKYNVNPTNDFFNAIKESGEITYSLS
ncbi:MAG: DNA polymerase III subunit alpha [Bacteroidota bacterium]|nr:DNA polymerase III subunit alpha [Bacteroidota bacterium]